MLEDMLDSVYRIRELYVWGNAAGHMIPPDFVSILWALTQRWNPIYCTILVKKAAAVNRYGLMRMKQSPTASQ
jgi:hypothetical protein